MDDSLPREKKFSWWERRPKAEKFLLAIVGLCAVLIIYLASNLLMKFPSKESSQERICMTEKCIRSSAYLLKRMDKSADPCEDFYRFACGKFIDETVIPGDETFVSSFSQIRDEAELELRGVFEEPVRDSDRKPLKLVKSVYQSCMNSTRIEAEGLDFIKKQLKDLGGWPVIDPYWNEKLFDWKKLWRRLNDMGWTANFFYSIDVDADEKNSSRHILSLSQPCLPHEKLKKGFNESFVRATHEYLVELAVLLGADRGTAVLDMKEVLDFMVEIAKIAVPYEERKNSSSEDNLMTIREFQRNFTYFPWLKLINDYLAPIDTLTSDDRVKVVVPKYFEKLEHLLPKIRKRTLANYMFERILSNSIRHLPEIFRKKEQEYVKVVYNITEVLPRWRECFTQASNLHVATSSIYVENFFDERIKHDATELVLDIKRSFLETLRKIGWMDRKTKKHAISKAEKVNYFIGYPDEILDDNAVDEYYRELEIDPEKYSLKVALNISKFHYIKSVQRLREPVRENDWRSKTPAFLVDAFYLNNANTIILPAASLQKHFFDPERPQYLNYGVIGQAVGHEIIHGFDDRGRRYDKDGNSADWWEPETNRTFARKSQCLVEQYGNFTVPGFEVSLDGSKNLGENIADNGGIKIAYKGYMKWLERNQNEPSLPGLSYTPRQLFWISAATKWCAKYKREMLKELITVRYPLPAYFQVVLPFMNSDYFARDFSCPLGSPMNPKYKCRVW